jgi:hypothetical protein
MGASAAILRFLTLMQWLQKGCKRYVSHIFSTALVLADLL